MNLNVISWNTRGVVREKISEVYGSLFIGGCKNIFLIQEAGADPYKTLRTTVTCEIGTKKFDGFFVEDPYAKNERCTTGIMVEKDAPASAAPTFGEIPSGQHRPAVMTTIACGTKPFILATVHAIAREDKAKEEIHDLYKSLNAFGIDWILMGDFNCEPEALLKTGFPVNQMSFTKEATHDSGKTLDYAIFSPGFINKIKVNLGFPAKPGFTSTGSDHSPVYFQLSL